MFLYARSNPGTFNAAPRSQPPDQTLIKSIAEGNKAALKLLYLRHRERVYRYAARLTGVEMVADEIVNDVFLAVWRHAGQFEGKSQVGTWLLRIARFKAISKRRRRAETPLDERAVATTEDPSEGPATAIEKHQRMDMVRRCLAKLTPLHRDVIDLIYYQGNNIEEVARSTGAVNTRSAFVPDYDFKMTCSRYKLALPDAF